MQQGFPLVRWNSILTISFAKTIITPSEAGWDSGDRQLTCIPYKETNKYPGGAPLHGSIWGSAR